MKTIMIRKLPSDNEDDQPQKNVKRIKKNIRATS